MTMISVVIPALDAARTIERCLESVLAEAEGLDVEILVVDDASTDATADRALSAGGSMAALRSARARLRILRNETRRGASHSRNRGIAEARGEWLTFVDADDELAPGALRALVTDAERTGADLVVGAHEKRFAGERSVLNRHGTDGLGTRGSFTLAAEELAPYVERYADEPYTFTLLVHCWGKLYRRSIVAEHALAFDEELEQLEDVHFVFNFLRRARLVRYVDHVCYVHHIASNGSMSTRSGSERDAVRKVERAYAPIVAFLVARCDVPADRAESLARRLLFTTCVIWLLRIRRKLDRHAFRPLARQIAPIVTSPAMRRGMADYRLRPRDSRVVFLGVMTGSPLLCAAALNLDTLLRIRS